MKRNTRDIEEENIKNFETYTNEKIYFPKDILLSISSEDLNSIYNKVKNTEIFRTKMKDIRGTKIIHINNPDSMNLIIKMQNFKNELEKVEAEISSNLQFYMRKRSKINIKLLEIVARDLPIEDRTLMAIKNKYNEKYPFNKVSIQTVRNTLKSKLDFRYISPDLKPKNYFNDGIYEKQIIFLYRLIKGIEQNAYIVFYDEAGFSSFKNQIKVWIQRYEKPIIKKNQTYKKYNLLMICSFTEILQYELNSINTDAEICYDFITKFITSLNADIRKKCVIVMDNHTMHYDPKLINFLRTQILRTLFIPEYNAQYNYIEMIFGLLKKNLQKTQIRTM